jgi:hypothetical protein
MRTALIEDVRRFAPRVEVLMGSVHPSCMTFWLPVDSEARSKARAAYASPLCRFAMAILAAIAKQECVRLSERVQAGLYRAKPKARL